jgi:hypothetical protein
MRLVLSDAPVVSGLDLKRIIYSAGAMADAAASLTRALSAADEAPPGKCVRAFPVRLCVCLGFTVAASGPFGSGVTHI